MKAFWFPVATIVLALSSQAAQAVQTGWVDTGKARVRLHADAARAAVEIELLPKWHTYWRYPGDAGVPPRFDWSGSENLAVTNVKFPTPQRFKEAAGQVIGYEDRVIFPIELKPADPSKPIKLRLRFDFAVCEKICIPAEAKFALDIPVNEPKSEAIDRALISIPHRVPAVSIGVVKPISVYKVNLERGKKPRIFVEVFTPDSAMPYDLFAEGPTEDWSLPLPEKVWRKENLTRFVIPVEGAPPGASPIPAKIRLTLYAGENALEYEVPLD
jgi:DsbC/DsbD-like thiol-disulfide interchange protein